jgi:putative flavoprotein involved in K+ transport
MDGNGGTERFETVVIGGGQAGLSVGYHLRKRGQSFVILDADERVGDSWRRRWDSLRLFTPAKYDGMDGMRFPAPRWSFPTKDAMGDYLEAYAARFELPVRSGVAVDDLRRDGGRYLISTGARQIEADQVVLATGSTHTPMTPSFASALDPSIVQLHSSEYLNPSQLREGDVLLVGSGNSGAEIGFELAATRRVFVAGRAPGQIPVRHGSVGARFLLPVIRFVGHRVLTTGTPVGRKVRPKFLMRGAPLIRVKTKDLLARGAELVPRVVGVRDGLPLLQDERVLPVANVIWCTGFRPDFSWIDLSVFEDGDGDHVQTRQDRGVVVTEPGLYFVGLHFQYAATSEVLPGVGRDAEYVAKHIAKRAGTTTVHRTEAEAAIQA